MARNHSKKCTGTHLNSQCKQCARKQERKVDGTEERIPVGVYRSTSTTVRWKGSEPCWKGTVVQDRSKKGGKARERWQTRDQSLLEPWANGTHCCKLRQGQLEQGSERCGKGKGDISEEVHEDENELHAWCSLEESENEQWQEVANKKSKLKIKKFAHESLLSVENNSCASSEESH